ncbi:hypothetical protein A6A08_23595 [Nocardiopsis sp. TSRI0078]|uniref:hypothetical protein n=1 Tax=unclassified Nocardiopsis TaxID=2649073 RepID=UPI00093BA551|nr:hypothetical protein [Nocardiopsis sp. TSRI0078]OKI20202.1 hypothetical protein A6A08_23595 [Nocardiopsis sp. TSRI0078]
MVSSLRSLAVLELVNVPLFAVVLFRFLSVPASPANLAGFALFALLLVQGGAYWWIKVRQLRTRARDPEGMPVFRALRWVDPLLLLAGGAVVAAALAGGVLWTRVWPGLGLWLFAVLEYVNYFHVQLSHQTRADLARLLRTGRLHRSHLARDMAR